MSYPTDDEIKAIGKAFVHLGLLEYSSEERGYLNLFLKKYAMEYHEKEIHPLFHHDNPTLEAIQALHHFAMQYKNQDIIKEFNDELADLLININDQHGALVI